MIQSVWIAGIGLTLTAFALTACQQTFQPTRTSDTTVLTQPELKHHSAPILSVANLQFRDLDRNGRLTPYEDWRLPAENRTSDLVGRMTLREKAGTMMHGSLRAGGAIGLSAEGYDLTQVRKQIDKQAISSFITRLSAPPQKMAEQNNKIQAIAEESRLGIPLTISTDPRNHFQYVMGASVSANGYSQWPEPLGFAALRNPERVRRFAEVARQEYRMTGIHQALSPQADLATEPRWARGTGTFGANPDLVAVMVNAYVAGFQGSDQGLTSYGVMTVVKHWVAYGATPHGWDGHNYYGRFTQADNESFALHVKPFIGAFSAHVSAVMPTYSIVKGVTVDDKPLEPVGAGFSKQLLTGLLRGVYGFGGIVLSDWAILDDCPKNTCEAPAQPGLMVIGLPWGVEDLSRQQRMVKGLEAGIDQFGGAEETDLLVDAVNKGLIDESRLDQSVQRILLPKFKMGLFENPYVDVHQAAVSVVSPGILAEGVRAQAESQVLLKASGGLQPLEAGQSVYLVGVDPDQAIAHGLLVVDDPEKADAAIVRMSAPFELLHPFHFFGSRQHEGRLDYRDGDADYEKLKLLRGKTRVIASIFLDRPAVLTNIIDLTDVLLGNFGISDDALLDVVTGRAAPQGRMPFELPSSMAAILNQDPAKPDDSMSPLFPYGAGIVTD
ncbi:glycoside hydrolase family 3 protein [Aestuariicella hydrocarbonica]|uniref:beta-glucosidase n=1 Tax=Pseudomaricurvus hydrocarbonicus TaxID=1470433 RepID=A0A9E5MN43_9GAMM|nr:glycoside hydrolase family 3 protein [Aestuariicella hydrocarbonica]NHO67314.1 glycoside hydrolase family 3 protein [Aestuariicella hydrocarbonica]